MDNAANVQALDLLGNGTACLVWSSSLPGDVRRPLRYLDLMGGQKPHLLVRTVNNLGAETTVAYAPSTRFYLQDKEAGNPWITKLPFPVHCVETVKVRDTWRNTTFSTTYSYHHGYFDGPEREFRGFGRVEQVDVEDYGTFAAGNASSPYITDDKTLYQPPVKTVTWYHTGAFLDRQRILSHYEHEYFPHWFEDGQSGQQVSGTFQEQSLPEPDLDTLDLSSDEWREALRACKDMMLRQEVYELDVDALATGVHTPVRLFSTAYHNCHIRRLQPRAINQHAVFHVTEGEAITYHYELDLRPDQLTPDPRVAHTLNTRIDEYGNILQAVAVVYPRLGTYVDATLQDGAQELIQHVQSELHLAYSETRYTNDVNDVHEPDSYRLRLPCEALTYELTGIASRDHYFTLDELRAYKLSDLYQTDGTAVEEIAYHLLPNRTSPQKRLVEYARSLFFAATLDAPLALGQLNALALPYESYRLALTNDMLDLVFKDRLQPGVQAALSDKTTGGYLSGADLTTRFGGEAVPGQYWICSGVAGFAPDAAQHFYVPERYTDPFGNPTTLTYDPYDLFIQSSTDALGNLTEVTKFDFRVLAPRQVKDANDNLSEVRFDVLGMPSAVAVMGKGHEGDNLNAFDDALLNPDLAAVQAFFVTGDYDVADARNLLRDAGARHVYYFGETIKDGTTLWGQHPACACSIVRERHAADVPDSALQSAFEYADGTGNVLVKKVQAEPELPGGPLRWIASGKTILNNKGKPVKQYEPYFSPPTVGHRFEEPAEMGVTPVMYYDAVGRVVRTESPDGSYSRVEFSPWHETHYDANDTVSEAGNAWFAHKSAPTASVEEQRAARLAAEHANTPAVTVLDSLGRAVVTIAHNRVGAASAPVDEKYVTFSKLDAEGKTLWIQDPRGNRVMQYIMPPLPDGAYPFNDANNLDAQGFAPCYDIAGNQLFQHSMDAGDRWMLNDAAGKPMFAWNSRGFITRITYDELHRPIALIVTDKDGNTFVAERTVYGETAFGPAKTDATARARAKQTNHLGKPYQLYDGAGVVTNSNYDFKGNLLQNERVLLRDYKAQVDWPEPQLPPQPLPLLLESEAFVSRTRYDALNRPIQMLAPHSTQRVNITQPIYNEAGLLERIDVWLNQLAEPATLLDPATASLHAVTNIDYNAKGQRLLLQYGNGAETSYDYEPDTFRLSRLKTTRASDHALLQNLNYTYDPIGNITQIVDNANDRVYHSNTCVLPGAQYRYDALYRLLAASGREHKGNGQQYDWDDRSRYASTLPNDCQFLQNYVETYRYDPVGNIMQMVHQAGRNLEQPGQVLWNRRYQYALDSNRLLATSLPGDPASLPDYVATPGYSATYTYDPHGNITAMPHLPQMNWDFKDQLSATTGMVSNGNPPPDSVPATTYYVYNAAGQRVRKITARQSGTRQHERIYLGGFELYREYDGSGTSLTLERETLHVMDDKQRIALVETKTIDAHDPTSTLQPLIRYQYGNHLGSVSLELDAAGQIISYEEYTPYGSTAYQAGRSAAEVSLKRYCYTGMERDEESGLNYNGARYYAPWLGRWTKCDPIGLTGGVNLYLYVRSNPIGFVDPTGTDGRSTSFNDFKKSKEWRDYVQAARDLQAANAKMDKFKNSKEYEPLARLEAAESRLEQLRKEQAAKQRELIAAQADLATKRKRAEQAIKQAEEAAIKAEKSAKSARFWTRIAAVPQAIGHTLEAAVACPLAETGIGAIGCIHATTSLYADMQTLSSGNQTPNAFHQMGYGVAKQLGANDKAANFVGGLTDAAGGGASAYVSLSRSAPTLATAGESSMQRPLVGTGTRAQFRADVLATIRNDPNHPLRFLLDDSSSTGFKQLTSRAHASLIENPDIWEAGHIMSDKLGGERLMIQSAWENQVQNLTVERFAGAGVLDNPAVDIGGIAVARSTATWWEELGWLSPGTVARAQVIQ
ncbi:hypothetical protein KDH_10000 [Dictyobacter sp. S3.2.2.5]|uniref:Uncharacterized protein n=1 Tax=Dictyobacter halimunensis TaxID=3026934 RepID=A0ABQ6FMV6_9CHLR|nr:hypothetical protein KDH_10000 [Dictyobacter sp. S3.2.2.5]